MVSVILWESMFFTFVNINLICCLFASLNLANFLSLLLLPYYNLKTIKMIFAILV